MALKGHATIELTNVETGDKRVIEEDNMVTNALSELLTSGTGVLSPYTLQKVLSSPTKEYSLLKRLTKGLLLFDSTINEDPSIIYAPPGVGLVGCASRIAYTGKNTMAGSYNVEESGPIDGGFKHVWDFGTSQANGSIACACLTTCAGGKISTGSYPYASDYVYNESEENDEVCLVQNSTPVISFPLSDDYDSNWDSSSDVSATCLYVDGINNRLLVAASARWNECNMNYLCSSDSDYARFKSSVFYAKSLDIKIVRAGFSNISIFDKPTLSSGYVTKDLNVIDTVHIEMPDEMKEKIPDSIFSSLQKLSELSLTISSDDNFLYIITKQIDVTKTGTDYVEKDGEIYIWKINVDTFESSFVKVKNTTGEKIYFKQGFSGGGYSRSYVSLYVFDGYLVCLGGTSRKMFLISLDDNTEVTALKFPSGTEVANLGSSISSNLLHAFYSQKKLFFLPYGLASVFCVLDPVSKQVAYKNAASHYLFEHGSDYAYSVYALFGVRGTDYVVHLYCGSISSYFLRLAYIDPSMLITINNLGSPVVKTSAETMKVTYTLTESVE